MDTATLQNSHSWWSSRGST